MTQMLTEALFIIVMIQKQSQDPSIDEWIKKMCYVCVCARAHTHTHTHTHRNITQSLKTEILHL